MKLIAYKNDKKLKSEKLRSMAAHIEADRLIHGSYWDAEARKGCAAGCTLEKRSNYPHSDLEDETGVPRLLWALYDRIFEGLDKPEDAAWAYDFLAAIPVGADLEMVWPKFIHWLLVDEKDGVIKFAKTERTKKSIQTVAGLYQRKINGEEISAEAWREAHKNADADDDADADAAYAAAAAAAYAAAAADDAADDAAYAAAAAADDADDDDARRAHFKKMAVKLIELIKATGK